MLRFMTRDNLNLTTKLRAIDTVRFAYIAETKAVSNAFFRKQTIAD